MADNAIIGIDIGATKTRMALFRNAVLAPFFHQPTPQKPEAFAAMAAEAIRRFLEPIAATQPATGPASRPTGTRPSH